MSFSLQSVIIIIIIIIEPAGPQSLATPLHHRTAGWVTKTHWLASGMQFTTLHIL